MNCSSGEGMTHGMGQFRQEMISSSHTTEQMFTNNEYHHLPGPLHDTLTTTSKILYQMDEKIPIKINEAVTPKIETEPVRYNTHDNLPFSALFSRQDAPPEQSSYNLDPCCNNNMTTKMDNYYQYDQYVNNLKEFYEEYYPNSYRDPYNPDRSDCMGMDAGYTVPTRIGEDSGSSAIENFSNAFSGDAVIAGNSHDDMSSNDGFKKTKKSRNASKEDKPFKCDECGYTCSALCVLKSHKITHTDIKPYACTECTYKCRQKGTLKRHKMIHSNLKPFACEDCNYTCRQPGTLRVHKLIHSKDEGVACEVCGEILKTPKAAKSHKCRKDARFTCEVCQYSCSQLSNLKRHQLIHREQQC